MIQVLLYNGQLDLIIGASLTEYPLLQLDEWEARDEYARATRKEWRVNLDDKDVAGYMSLGNRKLSTGRLLRKVNVLI